MNNTFFKGILAIGLVFFVLGSISYYSYRSFSENIVSEKEDEAENEVFEDSTVEDITDNGEVIENRLPDTSSETESENDAQVSLPVFEKEDIFSIPDLDRPIHVTENLSEEVEEKLIKDIQLASTILKESPDLFNDWLDLGTFRKAIGDYEGSRDAWEYASKIRPFNSISFLNLGILYGYYLKDNEKAEQNFLKAIENNPKDSYLYQKTADFYVDTGNTRNARFILQKALIQNPEEESVKNYLKTL